MPRQCGCRGGNENCTFCHGSGYVAGPDYLPVSGERKSWTGTGYDDTAEELLAEEWAKARELWAEEERAKLAKARELLAEERAKALVNARTKARELWAEERAKALANARANARTNANARFWWFIAVLFGFLLLVKSCS